MVGVVLFVASLTAATLDQNHAWHNAPGGLLERLTIILAWSWLSLIPSAPCGHNHHVIL